MTGALLLASLALAAAATAPTAEVAFAPAQDAALPVNARFTDEDGHAVTLGGLVASRPAIVVPAYYGCANLCTVVLRGVAASLAASGMRAGRDVEVIAVSIAPLDTPGDALAKKRTIAGAARWHFLTGSDAAIGRFADALAYRYFYVPGERQYAHASGIAIVAPGGRIARVLYGVSFSPADLAEAMAATHEPSSPAAREVRTWLLCFHYDPRTGRYSFAAMNAVRAAALAALLALAGYFVHARLRERRR